MLLFCIVKIRVRCRRCVFYDISSKHASFPNFVRPSIINCSRQLVPSELKQVSAVEISADKIYESLAIVWIDISRKLTGEVNIFREYSNAPFIAANLPLEDR